ncbi:MAG: AAA family ATPase [Anaerolineae bacterium]|nr:AAA family ATPase [Anaerolineae bacterium]
MSRKEELEHSIAALEAQRALLGDAVIGPALEALCKELAALEAPATSPDPGAVLRRLVPQTYAERLLATQGHAQPERRLVTILFSDVKGSTAMAETLDPEEVLEIMNGAFEFLIQPITRHEGTLARLMGDAILAFFGAPLAHENDPERAVRAALEIITGAQEYATRLENERGIQGFNVRVGINTGLVVVGEVGSDLRVEYTAMGDAINLAARMEQNAPIGGVLISQATYRLVQGLFEMTPQPPLMVKGKSQPIQTYIVHGARAHASLSERRGIEGIAVPMVGRDAELTHLQRAWQAVQSGAFEGITISGDAGVGKSRLLFEFQRWLREQTPEPLILKGRAVPETLSTPYGILHDLFARHLDIRDSDSAEVLQQKIAAGFAPHLPPERAHVVGHLIGFELATAPGVQKLTGSQAFAGQAQADLLLLFRAFAACQPLVLLFDDLHWADTASLDFIARLGKTLVDCRLLLICLTRPTLYERRPEWEQESGNARLNLGALSAEASQTLIEELLQKVHALPETLRSLIVKQAEGNPFYIEELIKMLLDEGVITCAEDGWQVEATRLDQLKVPATLTGVLQARIDGLPGAEKELLQQASVAGRDFWDALLLELNPVEQQALVQLLDSVQRRELVFRHAHSIFDNTGEYRFKHVILRDVVYETVLLKLRRRYHEATARWLEAHSGARVGEHAALIAEHYARAGNVAEAGAWFLKAGKVAQNISAYREAEAAYRRALEFIAPAERGNVHIAHGQVLEKLSRYDEAVQALETGIALTREHNPEKKIEGLTELSWINTLRGNHEAAFTHATEALNLAQKTGDRRELGRARMRYCSTHPDYDIPQTLTCYEEVLADFTAAGDPHGQATCLLNMGNIHLDELKQPENAAAYYRRSQELFREQGNRWGLNNCLMNLGITVSQQGNPKSAIQYFEEAQQLAQEIDDGEGLALGAQNLANAYLKLSEFNSATVYYVRSFDLSLKLGLLPLALITLANLAETALKQGYHEIAALRLGTVRAQRELFPRLGEDLEHLLSEVQAQLPPAAYEAALARGEALSLKEAGALLPRKGAGLTTAAPESSPECTTNPAQ